MRVENKSAYHATSKLYPIIDFVTEYTRYSALATLQIFDTEAPFSGGFAYKANPEIGPLSLVCPSLIKLSLRHIGTYPVTTCHVKGLEIEVRSWEEEVLLVLAHEARHIDQFNGYPKIFAKDQVDAAEKDAEKFALRLLKRWRRQQPQSLGILMGPDGFATA